MRNTPFKFNTYLAASYAAGVLILAIAVSLTAILITTTKMRSDLLHYGEGLANNLARESTLSLVYMTADNSRSAIEATLRFPYVRSLSIFTKDGGTLHRIGSSTPDVKRILSRQWNEGDTAIVQENDAQIDIVAPVFLVDMSAHSGRQTNAELLGWAHIGLDKKQLVNASLNLSATLVAVTIAIGLILFFAQTQVANLIASPLRKIAAVMARTSEARDYQEVDTRGPKEVKDIASAYNQLMRELKAINQNLERRIEERTSALSNAKEEAVRVTNENRRLIRGMNQRLEEERRYLSREIHDQLNGVIVSIRLALQRIQRRLANTDNASEATADAQKRIGEVIEMVSTTYNIARQIIQRLRPEVIDALGLRGALEDMIETYNDFHPDCDFSLSIEGDVDDIGEEVRIAIFRIVQEALTNSVKHSEASHVQVMIQRLHTADTHLVDILVQDNGKGMDAATNSSGIGILSMRERAVAVGGKVDINSTTKGTDVHALMPIALSQQSPFPP